MLVKRIPRGHGQRICIGPDVVVNIKRAQEGRLSVTIEAPRDFKIDAETTLCGIDVEEEPPNVVVGD
jgi:sRNA-binding carbon storage regulator CsrA